MTAHLGLSSNSPFGSRTGSYTTTTSGPSPSQSMQQLSRSQSPMATISRCQSPTHSAFSPMLGTPIGSVVHQAKLHQTIMASILGVSQNSPMASANSTQYHEFGNNLSKPLYPEICLEHVWTESSALIK